MESLLVEFGVCLACKNIGIGSSTKRASFWNNPLSFQFDHLGRVAHWVNQFHVTGPFLYTMKNTSGFLMFPGGLPRDQWHEMA